MSTVPTFRTVVFIGESSIQVFRPHKETWRVWEEEFAHDIPPSPALIEAVKDLNTLVVLSDAFAGHVQLSLPNKKEDLSEEKLAETLQEEYQIDLSVYEFASQRFAVGRQFVQVSVSGIEKEAYGRALAWASALQPKKLWVMPFGWFVSTLKSVEPALIAVMESKDRVHVSHHYLGVDDARQISFAQLAAYGESRKEERKETHLLYVQAEKKLFEAVEQEIGESLAVHPLIAESEGEPLEAVVNAVMDKGQETLKQLLHFEPSLDEMNAPAPLPEPPAEEANPLSAPEQAAILEEGLENTAPPSVDELPKPELPPAPPEVSAALRAPVAPPMVPEVVDADLDATPVGDEMVGGPVEAASVSTPEPEPEPVPMIAPKQELEAEPEPEPLIEEDNPLVQLAKVAQPISSNQSRYVEVQPKSHWKAAVGVFFLVFFLTALVGGAIFWSQQSQPQLQALIPSSTSSPTPSPEPTAEPSPEPTPEPEAIPEEARQGKKVLVLNATGVAGLAGKVKTKLEAAGWSGVRTGNATGSYADALFVMADEADLAEIAGRDLEEELKPTSSLKESGASGYDVVIVLAREPEL